MREACIVLLLLLASSALAAPPMTLYQQNRFHRLDPLAGLRFYDGGYDLRSKHYWASAAFTGVHGYVMSGFWALGGLILLVSFLIWEKKHAPGSTRQPRAASPHDGCRRPLLLAVLLLTLLVLAVLCITLAATNEFHKGADKLKSIVLGAAKASHHAMHRVLKATKEVHELLCSYDEVICEVVSSALAELRSESQAIVKMIRDNEGPVNTMIQASFSVTLGIICLAILLIIAKLVSSLVKWQPGLNMLICVCWLFTSLCWLLSGFHFFLHVTIDDTCLELDIYHTESDNSALTSMLPCPNGTVADFLMADLDFKVQGSTVQVYFNMSMFLNTTIPERRHEAKQFRSTCGDQEACTDARIASNGMRMSVTFENAGPIKRFVGVLPDIERLLHCSFVRDALNDVLSRQCVPLQYSIWLLWSSMFSVSVIMVVLDMVCVAVVLVHRMRNSHGSNLA